MTIPLLECIHLRKSTAVSFLSCETGVKECLYELTCQGRTDYASAENKNIHIVVLDTLVG